jgi:PadR family transcriptional regulator PadR
MKGLTRKEELLLLTIRSLRRDAYLVLITSHLAKAIGERITLPAVHTSLRRLEKLGYIDSELGEGTAVRGGRRKKIYRVTTAGYSALVEYRRISELLWTAPPNTVTEKR